MTTNPAGKGTGLNAPNRKLDDVLNDNEFARFLQKYGKHFLVGTGLFLVALTLFFVLSARQEKKQLQLADSIYNYSAKTFADYKEGKIPSSELLKGFNALVQEGGKDKQLFVVMMTTASELKKHKELEAAIKILEEAYVKYSSDAYMGYFSAVALSACYEDAGNLTKAIDLLEKQLKARVKFVEAKLYFDLGRLYKLSGNKEKARVNFDYVIAHYPQDEMVKFAKIYIKTL